LRCVILAGVNMSEYFDVRVHTLQALPGLPEFKVYSIFNRRLDQDKPVFVHFDTRTCSIYFCGVCGFTFDASQANDYPAMVSTLSEHYAKKGSSESNHDKYRPSGKYYLTRLIQTEFEPKISSERPIGLALTDSMLHELATTVLPHLGDLRQLKTYVTKARTRILVVMKAIFNVFIS
jgi:hypothetical protein